MQRPISVLAEGLGQPEGPCVLHDGRIVLTNTYRSEIVCWDADFGIRRYAYTGGAPNACLLGSDGAIYIANCPTAGSWVAPDRRPGCIQRATAGGDHRNHRHRSRWSTPRWRERSVLRP